MTLDLLEDDGALRTRGEFVFWFTEINTLMQVDDLTVLKKARGESFGESRVAEERTALREIKIGGENRAFSVAAVIHQAKEVIDLSGQRGINVTKLIHQQQIQSREVF